MQTTTEPARTADDSLPPHLAPDLIDAAWGRIRRALRQTPLVWSEHRGAHLKLETLQETGAFKVRGALNALAAQVERGDRRPVFAASAGNHGQGVAWAARRLGLEATIVVPESAPATKVDGCRRLRARVVVGGASVEACVERAAALAGAAGGRIVHPFEDPEVIAGQATLGLELRALGPDCVLVPIGGGGLAAGIAAVLAPRRVQVVGVQIAGIDGMRRALRGEDARRPCPATVADGLRVQAPGRLATALCARYLDDVVLVDEEEVRGAMRSLAARDRVLAEGAGAVAVAGLDHVRARRPVAIVSGGNVDPAVFASLWRGQ